MNGPHNEQWPPMEAYELENLSGTLADKSNWCNSCERMTTHEWLLTQRFTSLQCKDCGDWIDAEPPDEVKRVLRT